MGIEPEALGRLGFWQYIAAVQGWNQVHGSGEAPVEAPTSAEFHDMVERLGGDVRLPAA